MVREGKMRLDEVQGRQRERGREGEREGGRERGREREGETEREGGRERNEERPHNKRTMVKTPRRIKERTLLGWHSA